MYRFIFLGSIKSSRSIITSWLKNSPPIHLKGVNLLINKHVRTTPSECCQIKSICHAQSGCVVLTTNVGLNANRSETNFTHMIVWWIYLKSKTCTGRLALTNSFDFILFKANIDHIIVQYWVNIRWIGNTSNDVWILILNLKFFEVQILNLHCKFL